MDQGVSPGARMPGRANGSILSLVNRAVNSNIFMRDWQGPIAHEPMAKVEWTHRVLWPLSRIRDKVDKQ